MPSGYYRHPTIHADTVVFVCEDDLWTVPVDGGIARRLTSGLGEASRPFLSPDGAQIAFVGQEEGQPEVYVMPAQGGQAERLTYLGGSFCQTAGWTRDGKILFFSNARQPIRSMMFMYTVDGEGGAPALVDVGAAEAISYGPRVGVVIGRKTADPARWKRYRGGTAGQLWIDVEGRGEFRPLLQMQTNLASPMWIGDRIYFVSDHEGIGNLYSCLPSGQDLRRHTDHEGLYARNPTTDGRRIVYHAGADLYLYDPVRDTSAPIPVEFHSPQTQRNRKFVETDKYVEDAHLAPNGQSVAITARGRVFAMANWEGAVIAPGDAGDQPARYRLATWLWDGERLVAVSDANGEESIVLLRADASAEPERLDGLDVGRPVEIAADPKHDRIAFANHRYELMVLDLATRELRVIDRGHSRPISGFAWSPDGAWLAYSVSISLQVDVLKLWQAESGRSFPLTRPILRDVMPAFDPQGKYLYLIGCRHFDPVYDSLHFDLNFPRGMKPYLIPLQKDLTSPFVPTPKKEEDEKKENGKKEDQPTEQPVRIDLDGIDGRLIAFPVEDGRYGRILGAKEGKVLYARYPIQGALSENWMPSSEPPAKGTLFTFNWEEQKEEVFVAGITNFDVSTDGGVLLYRAGNRLRALKTAEKPEKENGSTPNRKNGWLDLDRVKVSVVPGTEWRQMFREAWRLQRDQFWSEDMSRVDWLAVHDRYLPLVERVASRSEFSDLMWEMQGELGTSHAYELGGDYRPHPHYAQGMLGADYEFDAQAGAWRIRRIVRGDVWDPNADSPLDGPGINVKEGDRLLAIDGVKLSRSLSPEMALVDRAGDQVALSVEGEQGARVVTVKALRSEMPARYREWVERNRERVHTATGGRVGYVHIPDMGPLGYAEFHRGYLAEVDREGLVVDIRFNGGGNVSPLILEKLARRRVGYDVSRWGRAPEPYPPESVLGPMVALTNEMAGSDGDIFSHGFKLMKLGPLLGKRTWGGVIGIWPRHALVDGTVTTQPEFSFWFQDVGWGVENYGTDPDIEVDNRPQDYVRGVDAQLERAIEEIQRLIEGHPPRLPEFDKRPSRALPKLPRR